MHVVVIGGGPAGLAAAYELAKAGIDVTVLERHSCVGGLARTEMRNGCRFDIGPHRFFTKNAEVNQLWYEVLGADLLSVDRITRILYRNKLFDYPLTPVNTLTGVGCTDATAIIFSYVAALLQQRINPKEPENFEEWVVQHFGWRLYSAFFRTYTEKVWGIPGTDIGVDWAKQRIKSLTLSEAIRHALGGYRANSQTRAQRFLYPRYGAGQLYEGITRIIQAYKGAVLCDHNVVRVRHENGNVVGVTAVDRDGHQTDIDCTHCLSSAPLSVLIESMSPELPADVRKAAKALRYRAHIAVNLVVQGNPFRDQWIYIHSHEARMARVANYRNFSADMSRNAQSTPLTVEYFSFVGDELWLKTDVELLDLAKLEMDYSGLCSQDAIVEGFVVRSKQAYPVIEVAAQARVAQLRSYLSQFTNLWQIGRSGMFKYNNQDHAIMTGLIAARGVQGDKVDPWRVNSEAEYHEERSLNAAVGASANMGLVQREVERHEVETGA